MASGDIIRLGSDLTLNTYFGWAGKSFPYAGTTDVTISANTTWKNSDAEVRKGFKKIKKLIIAAGVTLTINKSPFYLFADEIVFGNTASCIDISGPSASSALTAFPTWCARGSTANNGSGAQAQGGCGGGILLIVCRKISGANGIIKANGGNGWRNTVNHNATSGGYGGQGALSSDPSLGAQDWSASPLVALLSFFKSSLGAIVAGGGSGQSYNNQPYVSGGSGIGGGGNYNQVPTDGTLPIVALTPSNIITLAQYGCLGGGGGMTIVFSNTGAKNAAGGGGGGAVCVWASELVATPVLQANGGIGVNGEASTCNGGAGVTHLIQI